MRLIILAACAALALAACRNNDQTDNTANIDENLSAQNIVSNDVTAIDAVTGDAANMAADVDVNFTEDQPLDNGSDQSAPAKTSANRSHSTAPSPAPAPTPQPATNTTGNTTG